MTNSAHNDDDWLHAELAPEESGGGNVKPINEKVHQHLTGAQNQQVAEPRSEKPESKPSRTFKLEIKPKPLLLGCIVAAGVIGFASNYQTIVPAFSTWLDTVMRPELAVSDTETPVWQQRMDELSTNTDRSLTSLQSQVQTELKSYEKTAAGAYEYASQNSNAIGQIHVQINEIMQRLVTIEQLATQKPETVDTAMVDQLTSYILNIDGQLAEVIATSAKNEKNYGWLHNRLTAVESSLEPEEANINSALKQAQHLNAPSRKTELVKEVPWRLAGASSNNLIAFIVSKADGKTMRITKGSNVPQCGVVTNIDAKNQVAKTDTCTIKRVN